MCKAMVLLQEQSRSNAAFRLPPVPQPRQIELLAEDHAAQLRAPPADVLLAVFRANQPPALDEVRTT